MTTTKAFRELIEAASNVTVSTATDFNKHWAEKLDKAIDAAEEALREEEQLELERQTEKRRREMHDNK